MTYGARRQAITVYGPDPAGTAAWDALAERTALELSGMGAPASVRVGMTGSPERTAYGDLGPLQRPALSHGAPNAFPSLNAGQALPSTGSPVDAGTDLTGDSSLKALVGSFGL